MRKKELLRKKMNLKLNTQKNLERRNKSKVIQNKISRRKDFLNSECLMMYVSKGTKEVDTVPLIKKALNMGKKVVLPVVSVRDKKIKPVRLRDIKKDLVKGPYGIYEPKQLKNSRPVRIKDINMIIVPGVAFDKKNARLGHGQGYYDRFLKRVPKDIPKIGLGFRFQLVKKIPVFAHDISLTQVITN